MREDGYYKVLVKEFGPPFWTIGLFETGNFKKGCWLFAEGCGYEAWGDFEILEVIEQLIAPPREYVK